MKTVRPQDWKSIRDEAVKTVVILLAEKTATWAFEVTKTWVEKQFKDPEIQLEILL